MRRLLRPLLLGIGATVAAILVYGLLIAVLGAIDADDLDVSTSFVVVSSVLFALPFGFGAWIGTRSGLHSLAPPAAVAAGSGGALVVFALVTLTGGGTDALSVLLPAAGTAAGAGYALRTADPA